MTRTTRIAATAVALCLVAVTFSGAGLAASNGSITAEPADTGATATHTVTVTVGEASAGTWNGLAVDYRDSGVDLGDVTRGDLARIGVDEGADDPDDAIDREVGMSVEAVNASDGGARLTVSLDGSTDIEAGDELVVVYGNVTNPESEGMDGGWEVGLDIDPESTGGETTATLSLGESMNDSNSMDDDSMNDSNSMDDDSMNDSNSMDDNSMNDSNSMDDNSMNDSGSMNDSDSMDDNSMNDSDSMDDNSMNDSDSMDDNSMNDSGSMNDSDSMDDNSMNDSDSMDDNSMNDEDTGVSQPGFGVLAALVALVGAGLLVARRRG